LQILELTSGELASVFGNRLEQQRTLLDHFGKHVRKGRLVQHLIDVAQQRASGDFAQRIDKRSQRLFEQMLAAEEVVGDSQCVEHPDILDIGSGCARERRGQLGAHRGIGRITAEVNSDNRLEVIGSF